MFRAHRSRAAAPTVVLLACLAAPAAALAGPYGVFDTTFDGTGIVRIAPDSDSKIAPDRVVVRPDGGVVALGQADPFGSGDPAYTLVARRANGQADPDFGPDGHVNLVYPSSADVVGKPDALAVQPDGKLLVGVPAPPPDPDDGIGRIQIVRLLPDGNTDPGFGTDGTVTESFSPTSDPETDEEPTVTAIVPVTGGLLVAGTLSDQTDGTRSYVRRYKSDGTPDTGFGTGGTFVGQFDQSGAAMGSESTYAGDLAALPDGTSTLLASAPNPLGAMTPDACVLARLTAAGHLQTGFGTGGTARLSFGTASLPYSTCRAVAESAAGAVTVGANDDAGDTFGGQVLLARLTASGGKDASFGGGVRAVGPATGTRVGGLALQPDGKVVASYSRTTYDDDGNATSDFEVVRLTAGAAADGSFGTNGALTTDFGVSSLAWDPAGHIVAGGSSATTDSDTGDTVSTGIIARLTADTPPKAAISGPATATAEQAVSLSGAPSTDPNGAVTRYAWDLDGDGAYDDATTQVVSTRFTTPGAKTVALKVSDANGLTNTISKTITVSAPPASTTTTPTGSTTTTPPASTTTTTQVSTTTPPPPSTDAATTTTTPPPPPLPPGLAKLASTRLRVAKSGAVSVAVSCPGGGGPCVGTAKLTLKRKSLAAAKRYAVPAGSTASVKLTLKKAARKALAKRGRKGEKLSLVLGTVTSKVTVSATR